MLCGSYRQDGVDLMLKGIPALTEASISREDGKWKNADEIQLPQRIHSNCR